jgi:hypothetical protein
MLDLRKQGTVECRETLQYVPPPYSLSMISISYRFRCVPHYADIIGYRSWTNDI